MSNLQFTSDTEGSIRIAALGGRLDNQTAPEFDKQIADFAGSPTILDLANLQYISSAGLRSVLSALKRATASGGQLVLAAPIPAVVEVFEISGFITLVKVFPDREAALAALR